MIKTRSIQLWNDVKRWYSLPFVQIKLTLPKAPNQESSLANWTLRFSKDHQYEGVWMGPLQKVWKTPKNWDHFGFQFFRLLRRKENIFCWFHSSLDLDTRVWFKQFVLVLKDWIKFKNGHQRNSIFCMLTLFASVMVSIVRMYTVGLCWPISDETIYECCTWTPKTPNSFNTSHNF